MNLSVFNIILFIKSRWHYFFNKSGNRKIPVHWIQKDPRSWLAHNIEEEYILTKETAFSQRIEKIACETNSLGRQPLWEGYNTEQKKMPDEVRSNAVMGDFYTNLIIKRKPNIVVEFGSAFGVSGMYFMAGLELNGKGKLLSFEANDKWAGIAKTNIARVGNNFELVYGTFEENIHAVLSDEKIDVAFIDAIHTKEFVIPQLEIVLANSTSDAIIIMDDINFSEDMRECWKEVSQDKRFTSSLTLGPRVGILERKS